MSAPAGMIARTMIVLITRVVPQPTSSASTAVISGRLRSALAPLVPLHCASYALPVDVTEVEVERSQDRHDVGNVHTPQHPGQDRDVAERRGPDLHAERAGRALRDDVVAHLAQRVLGLDPDLALGH